MDIRLGIIGFGGIGIEHARRVIAGGAPGLRLAAVANRTPSRMDALGKMGAEDVARFADYREMLKSGLIDAVLIATPHPTHFRQGMDAFEAGMDVVMEKPACLTAVQARALIAAAKERGLIYAMMFNKRETPVFIRMKQMLSSGELGSVRRVSFISTAWLRAQCYYDFCGWRGTWKGEGGGVLLNQAPHALDIMLWLLGMPQSVSARCHEGKWHDIEVEDDVTAYMEWKEGFAGTFTANTGEAPGTERLEIAADNGTLIYEDGTLTLKRLETPISEFIRDFQGGYGTIAHKVESIPFEPEREAGHTLILRDFVRAVRERSKPLADGCDGLNQVLLSNAMHLSSWLEQRVEFPMEEGLYEEMLGERIARSRPKPDTGRVMDTSSAFGGK